MEVGCSQILPMVLTMRHGQNLLRKDAVWIFTKQLESCQSHKKDGHCLGIILQDLTTHWMSS